MRYDDPQLRDLLAGEYVLGTMKPLTRARFERLMRQDPALVGLVGAWAERLAPLDDAAPVAMPRLRVWRAIEARLPAKTGAPVARWLGSLALWRGLAAGAMAVAAALLLYVALAPRSAPPVIAVLYDQSKDAGWIATAGPRADEVTVKPIATLALDPGRAFELWAIAGGPPRSLGLLPAQADRSLVLPARLVPPTGGVLAVSLEPAGGSPSGSPTGPVLYQGRVLAPAS